MSTTRSVHEITDDIVATRRDIGRKIDEVSDLADKRSPGHRQRQANTERAL